MNDRTNQLTTWLSAHFSPCAVTLTPLAGDASFRRYFRVIADRQSFVVMDAPPEKESCAAFVDIAAVFQQSPVRFPEVIAQNLSQGFLLLTDFGDQQLLPLLTDHTVDHWYGKAIDTLLQMHSHPHADLPLFDYWREFDIFSEWYLQKNKAIILSSRDTDKLRGVYQLLVAAATTQPQVFVHRDYHSRNLMVCEDGELGVLDFQDAVRGPITYDLASLLRDCYVAWPREKVENWARDYYLQCAPSVDFETFLRWFDWVGLQRHLKCLGIFSRLSFRDQKHHYLNDIPRVLDYAIGVCERYPELIDLRKYL